MKQKPIIRFFPVRDPVGSLFIVSVGLNLVLLLFLITHRSSVAARFPIVQPANSSENHRAGLSVSRIRRTHPARSAAVAGFTWADVESTDYRQYVANLRGIGCPEQTVRDIILAELNELYTTWQQATGKGPEIRKFWQKGKAESRWRDTDSVAALRKEELAVAEQIIGARVEPYDLALMIGIYSDRVDLAFLPEEKREPAHRALSELKGSDAFGQDSEELYRQKVAALSRILSTEELEEYRMRNGPGAWSLRSVLTYFDCTPQEFQALMNIRDEIGKKGMIHSTPEPQLAEEAEAFGQLFGEERGREFQEKTDLFYIWSEKAAERLQLETDAADQAWKIKQDAIFEVRKLWADSSIPIEQRNSRLEELHSATEARLLPILGAKGLAIAKLGNAWLQNPTVNFGP